jgi:hypothetical protein
MSSATITPTSYDESYLASLPPNILALMKLGLDYTAGSTSTGRTNGFTLLAQQGYIIDEQIMVMGEDPYGIMQERAMYGYKSVLAYLQPKPVIQVPPGVTFAGITGSPNQGNVIVYWPNPPAPLNPPTPPPSGPTLTLSIAIIGYPNFYEMNGDSPSIPVGYVETIGVDKYTKTIISQSPFAPNGVVTGWYKST